MHIVAINSWPDLLHEEEGITYYVRSLVFHNTGYKAICVWSSNESAVTSMDIEDSLYKTLRLVSPMRGETIIQRGGGINKLQSYDTGPTRYPS